MQLDNIFNFLHIIFFKNKLWDWQEKIPETRNMFLPMCQSWQTSYSAAEVIVKFTDYKIVYCNWTLASKWKFYFLQNNFVIIFISFISIIHCVTEIFCLDHILKKMKQVRKISLLSLSPIKRFIIILKMLMKMSPYIRSKYFYSYCWL